jgi:formylglycine-generating enzyme required for sulfatase activity
VAGFRIALSRNRKVLKILSLALAASVASAVLVKTIEPVRAEAPAAPAGAPEAYVEKIPGTDASFKMVPIPGGTFSMGSPDGEKDRKEDEGPAHDVKIEPFFMEEHEVTWGEYNLFLDNYNRLSSKPPVAIPQDKTADAVTYPTPMYDVEAAPKLERMGGRGPEFPAVIMSQFAARQYTKWISKKTGRFYRLPSEAEWEYAARCGTKTAYFFGDDPSKLGDYAWFNKNSNESDGDTGYHPIMKKKPSPWGLYDIYGNAAEWCVDQYDADWYKKFAGKVTDNKDTINWPTKPYPRALRGGFYDSEAAECRSASRLGTNRLMNAVDPQIPKSPHWMSDGFFISFRVIAPVTEPSEAEKLKWWEADDQITIEVIKRDRERKEIVEKGATK